MSCGVHDLGIVLLLVFIISPPSAIECSTCFVLDSTVVTAEGMLRPAASTLKPAFAHFVVDSASHVRKALNP